jgi:hypothetical protein
MKLKRKEGFTATVTKPGYQSESASVESKFSGGGGVAAAGNILVGGIIGGIVDGTNGSLNSFFPRALSLVLKPLQSVVMINRGVTTAPFGTPVVGSSAPVPVELAGARATAERTAPGFSYVAPRGSDERTASERFEQALQANQPVRRGSQKQGWTISD